MPTKAHKRSVTTLFPASSNYSYASHNPKSVPVLALNTRGFIDVIDLPVKSSNISTINTFRLAPTDIANASILFQLAKELGLTPGLNPKDDQVIINYLFAKVSADIQNPQVAVAEIIAAWNKLTRDQIARQYTDCLPASEVSKSGQIDAPQETAAKTDVITLLQKPFQGVLKDFTSGFLKEKQEENEEPKMEESLLKFHGAFELARNEHLLEIVGSLKNIQSYADDLFPLFELMYSTLRGIPFNHNFYIQVNNFFELSQKIEADILTSTQQLNAPKKELNKMLLNNVFGPWYIDLSGTIKGELEDLLKLFLLEEAPDGSVALPKLTAANEKTVVKYQIIPLNKLKENHPDFLPFLQALLKGNLENIDIDENITDNLDYTLDLLSDPLSSPAYPVLRRRKFDLTPDMVRNAAQAIAYNALKDYPEVLHEVLTAGFEQATPSQHNFSQNLAALKKELPSDQSLLEEFQKQLLMHLRNNEDPEAVIAFLSSYHFEFTASELASIKDIKDKHEALFSPAALDVVKSVLGESAFSNSAEIEPAQENQDPLCEALMKAYQAGKAIGLIDKLLALTESLKPGESKATLQAAFSQCKGQFNLSENEQDLIATLLLVENDQAEPLCSSSSTQTCTVVASAQPSHRKRKDNQASSELLQRLNLIKAALGEDGVLNELIELKSKDRLPAKVVSEAIMMFSDTARMALAREVLEQQPLSQGFIRYGKRLHEKEKSRDTEEEIDVITTTTSTTTHVRKKRHTQPSMTPLYAHSSDSESDLDEEVSLKSKRQSQQSSEQPQEKMPSPPSKNDEQSSGWTGIFRRFFK